MELTNEIAAPTQLTRSIGSSNATAAANSQHGETPVANIPYRIYNPFPRTNQVLMHWRDTGSMSIAAATTEPQQLTYRLNSITDIKTDITYGADPDRSAADTIDSTPNIPAMRNFWSCVYDYYTVIRSRYHFRIRPNNATSNNSDAFDVFQHMHGKQIPPKVTTGTTPVPWNYRKRFPHTIHKQVKTMPANNDHFQLYWTDFYGEWYPGMINHEVEEDELKKTWIKFNNTPPIGEFLTFVGQRSSLTPNTRAMDFIYEISIEYEVQLKSLKDQFQYIRPGVTISMDPPNLTNPVLDITAAQVYNQLNPAV
jgi:hypothetical protein